MASLARRSFYWFLGVCAFLALLAYFLRYSWTFPVQSDFANALLMAGSMLHGNILLHGWYLSPDSFWLTDLPIYVVGIALRGVTPSLLHDIPALLYTLTVFLAFFLMTAKVDGPQRWITVGSATLALIAIPPFFAGFVLIGPMHIGTLDAVLGLLLLNEYRQRIRVWVYWAASVALFAVAILSDPFALWMYYVPLAMYTLVVVARTERRGRVAASVPFLAATASLGLSKAFKLGVVLAGGLHTAPLNAQFASFTQIGQNLSLLVQGVFGLYGASFFGQQVGVAVLPLLIHLVLMAVALFVVFRVVYRWARVAEGDSAPVVLSLAAVLVLLEYAFSTSPNGMSTSRYLIPVVVFSFIALGRTLRLPAIQVPALPRILAGVALVAALVIPAAQGATSTFAIEPPQQLAMWLAARHLTYGYGAYWDASIVSVYSGDTVRVRAVASNGTRLIPFDWLSAQRWYTTHRARFLVFDADSGGVNLSSAEATWGKSQAVDTVGPYTVAIWRHPLSFN